ncbi:tRNA-binding protein [uncultured Sphingomonas sp.]|uniref:tRNA-binding protein n=1 Tax=uncultured Sphingomonas sp. TaxID=158754 RepID=UPI0035C94D66
MHLVHDPAAAAAAPITFQDFLRVDIRAGTIVEASPFPTARNPSYILRIDFGPGIGVRKSAAQITERHALADLVGRRVLAVVNFPPRQIADMRSEVLVLGLPDADGAVVLAEVDPTIPDGARLA